MQNAKREATSSGLNVSSRKHLKPEPYSWAELGRGTNKKTVTPTTPRSSKRRALRGSKWRKVWKIVFSSSQHWRARVGLSVHNLKIFSCTTSMNLKRSFLIIFPFLQNMLEIGSCHFRLVPNRKSKEMYGMKTIFLVWLTHIGHLLSSPSVTKWRKWF